MDDSVRKPFMPADVFGRSLAGFGVNILVSDVAATLSFLQQVLTVAVVGVGLNVSQTPEELPVETATSLMVATGSEPDRAALLGETGQRCRHRGCPPVTCCASER